jgi:putative endonuclease
MRRRDTGILGEKIASNFLKKRGYHIEEANYRCPEGEVDLIARHQDYLVFIEVRTKRSQAFGTPEESITATKEERLKNVAAYYQQTHDALPQQCRIDVVAIELDSRGRPSRIELIENAISDD